MKNTVAVLGAGIVGTCCALELQRRGHDVTLIDRKAPGRETSYGNAGVIARSSLIPFNNPGLWSSLPGLLKNDSPQFRYDPGFLVRNPRWALSFLRHARQRPFTETVTALDALIRCSATAHRSLLAEAGAAHRLRDKGWLLLYRSEAAFDASRFSRDIYDRHGVATQALDAKAVSDLEPGLKPIFPRSLWVKDADSVDSPGKVVEAYADLFVARGGHIAQASIAQLRRSGADDRWQLVDEQGAVHEAGRIVLALGPWTKAFAKKTLGVSIPLAFERGYHAHFSASAAAALNRPIYDTAGGYVLTPMEQGLRLSTGVQLCAQDAPANPVQLELAERAARQAFPLDARIEGEIWLGNRPTLPDSRPMIGECPRRPGIWLAFGHQHIGFGTGPGSAILLGALMSQERCEIDAAPFRPSRFIG